ncbi:hypothetical protein ILUMI_02039 [Ignelater luminosus]|uniref:PiggyBac transposable element-derived protein domain-containing protein n=1 Tax=Ignelater luminosus TaxID=2038154 RepID=A0A8K0DPJ9_IGNLU|nr:hypothetical protein ILUMI_02039 [Ignelater luminosus]
MDEKYADCGIRLDSYVTVKDSGDEKIMRPSNLPASQLAVPAEMYFDHPQENDDDLIILQMARSLQSDSAKNKNCDSCDMNTNVTVTRAENMEVNDTEDADTINSKASFKDFSSDDPLINKSYIPSSSDAESGRNSDSQRLEIDNEITEDEAVSDAAEEEQRCVVVNANSWSDATKGSTTFDTCPDSAMLNFDREAKKTPITDELLDLIVRETHLYAHQCLGREKFTESRLNSWRKTDCEKIRRFLLVLVMDQSSSICKFVPTTHFCDNKHPDLDKGVQSEANIGKSG